MGFKIAEEYTKKTKRTGLIVIDGMSCLRKFYGKSAWICGGQWNTYVETVENFVKKMRSQNINFVFFFDGNTPVISTKVGSSEYLDEKLLRLIPRWEVTNELSRCYEPNQAAILGAE